MKKIAIIIFDYFTDIDLFLMWDLLERNRADWQVKILGMKSEHCSCNGLLIQTHGRLEEANEADIVLFSSGKGTRQVIQDQTFLKAFKLNPDKQVIASICSGALILAKLGILQGLTATTHPRAKAELQALDIIVLDQPLVCHDNIATAGGCLSAVYLVGWLIEKLFGKEKRKETVKEILPVGQQQMFDELITQSIQLGLAN